MLIRFFTSIACCLFIFPSIFAQTSKCEFEVEGYAFDYETKKPLSFVNVSIKGTTLGTETDDEGYFRLTDLCEKEYDLVFSYLGYKTVEHHHDFHHPSIEVFLAPDGVLLESIVVEAEAVKGDLNTNTASSLSSKELESVASESFGDVASKISGVSMLKVGQNVVKPVIHGLHSNRILVVNEGLRHEFQNWGTDHAPEIDPSLIDELTVVKGAATVRYGPDALGGVILINAPKMELSTPLRGQVRLTGKSNGRSGEATVKLQKGFKWWSVIASASRLKQGDLSAPNYLLTNTGKDEESYAAGLRIHPLPELDVEVYYSKFKQELGILRGSVNGNLDDLLLALESNEPIFIRPFSYDINTPKQGVEHDLYKAKASWVTNKQSFTIQYGYQLNKRKEFDVRRGNDLEIPNINLELINESLDAEWVHPSIGILSGRIGAHWSEQTNDNIPGTNTIPFIPNYDQVRYGAYLIENLDFGNSLLEFGVRYDYQTADIAGREPNNNIYRNTITYENFSATIGYKTQLNEHTTFRTNLGTAWRPPNISELYRFGRHLSFLEYGLWRYEINEERDLISTRRILDEEDRPVPSEVGYKLINTFEYNKNGFQAEITAHVNFIENYINAIPGGLTRTVRGTSPFFLYVQDDALIWGIDFAAKWEHSELFSSNFNTSYVWARSLPDNDFFADIPPIIVNYEIAFRPRFSFLDDSQFKLFTQYTFEQYEHPRILTVDEIINAFRTDVELFANNAKTFDLAPPPPGFWLFNVSWEGRKGHLGWQFQVQNLLNTSYRRYTDRLRYYADDIGRNFILSLSYRI
ncbi:MAG: TonB-dependent receptor [Bacteroidota bacterium]